MIFKQFPGSLIKYFGRLEQDSKGLYYTLDYSLNDNDEFQINKKKLLQSKLRIENYNFFFNIWQRKLSD